MTFRIRGGVAVCTAGSGGECQTSIGRPSGPATHTGASSRPWLFVSEGEDGDNIFTIGLLGFCAHDARVEIQSDDFHWSVVAPAVNPGLDEYRNHPALLNKELRLA